MKFTIKTTLESVSFAVAKLRDEELGGFTVECKTETGRYMRELAHFFGKPGAICLTFEAESPQGETVPHGTLVPHPANVFTHPMAPMAVRDERPCSCPATSEYDPPCPTHGVLGIGVTGQATAPAPPIVNGRPSCCREGREDDVLWIRKGQWIVGTTGVHALVRFCPFCGAKLPEVPR